MREIRAAVATGRKKEKFQFQILDRVRFDLQTGCWIYTGNLTDRGYSPNHWSQRISYTLWRGVIPVGLVLDHNCEVKPCLNPWHLDPVTDAVNIAYRDGRLERCHV